MSKKYPKKAIDDKCNQTGFFYEVIFKEFEDCDIERESNTEPSHDIGNNLLLPPISRIQSSFLHETEAHHLLEAEFFVHLFVLLLIKHVIDVFIALRGEKPVHGDPLTGLAIKAHDDTQPAENLQYLHGGLECRHRWHISTIPLVLGKHKCVEHRNVV